MKHKITLLITLAFLTLINIAFGQSTTKEFTTSSLKAMGAPNNPKVEIAWNRYYDTKEIEDICKRLAKSHPNLIKHSSIGKSVEGRNLNLLTVTNFNKGDANRKPAMYIDANIHSNEIQGSEVSLYTAWYLAENYGKIDWITELLDNKTFYIVPTINPDGRDNFIHEPNSAHSPRTGMLPRDDDGDGLIDEDGPDDLDGDGNITMMRKLNPNGRWKIDPDDTRLMIRAKPDEKGMYDLLEEEGYDNDGDGLVNEDGPGSYDSNRNFGWNWQPSYIQWGSDQYPFSIPEMRAVAEFVISHENIGGAQSYHNSGGMILRGPGVPEDTENYNPQDLECYNFLGKLGEEMLPAYRYLVTYKDLYRIYGDESEWFYATRGIFTFVNELWTSFDYFRKKPGDADNWFGVKKESYRFDKLLLFEEGIVPWKKVNHPQYGEIEVGGFKKSWTRTAPSFMIEDMCHRNMAFTLFHAYHLPQISIDSVKVQNLPGGLKQVDVVIKNSRILPTRSTHEIKNKITVPDYITLKGNKAKVIAGFIVENPLLDIAVEQKYKPEQIIINSVPGMETVKVRWIVSGEPPFEIVFDSKKGGLVKANIQR